MAKPQTSFSCTECGFSAAKWSGQCSSCNAWGTFVESLTPHKTASRTPLPPGSAPKPISSIETEYVPRWASGIDEFDRILGGGFVPGAAILLTGEPGIGKSTLLLDVVGAASKTQTSTLYVSAEESLSQVHLRAKRTSCVYDNLFLLSENDLDVIITTIESLRPSLVIIDSVQTILSKNIDASAGGSSQVRYVASALIQVAKQTNVPIIMVGHVTKDGAITGPKLLEHLVDVVCHFEGDRHSSLRFIRCLKNRFGPTDEIGCFEMTGEGIIPVSDPSALFLSRGQEPVSGTCITVAMEGSRPLLAEIQALVVPTTAPNPRRVTNGVDSARVAMILAILERRVGLRLSEADVYVSTVGGVRLVEPAADLAIALALTSALRDATLPHTLVACGEISLAGEIRPVANQKRRAQEATRLGHTIMLDSGCGTLKYALAQAFTP